MPTYQLPAIAGRHEAGLAATDSSRTSRSEGIAEASDEAEAHVASFAARGDAEPGPYGEALSARPNPARTLRMLAGVRDFSLPPARVVLAIAMIASALALLLGS